MPIRVTCTNCRSRYRFADEDAGLSTDCPNCGAFMEIPPLEAAAPVDLAATVTASEALSETVSAAPPEEPRQVDHGPSESLMKPTKEINFEDLIDMTAMVDIVFFLLIFFLVTSLQTVDSVIDMPRPRSQQGAARSQTDAPETPEDGTTITVRIDRADRITVEGTEIRGPDEIFQHLRELRNGPGRPNILSVIGHGDATHGTLVSVLDAGQELGFEKIQFGVVEEEEGMAGL